MPRTVEEMTAQVDELARRFEAGDIPAGNRPMDARSLRDVREAFEDLVAAQKRLTGRISVARAEGQSWALIGMMVGTSGEAARQRYGKEAPAPTVLAAPSPASERVRKAAPQSVRARKAAAGKYPGGKSAKGSGDGKVLAAAKSGSSRKK